MSSSTEIPGLIIEGDDPVGETAEKLITELCEEMTARYGAPPSPFSLCEAAAPRTIFVVARVHGEPVACGALRRFDDDTAEIKRMYVAPSARRRGLARHILATLEHHAQELRYRTIRLETGVRQPEAQRLYESMGFQRIEPFGSYVGNPTSICFEKTVLQCAQSPDSLTASKL